jgi:hypothetical protein
MPAFEKLDGTFVPLGRSPALKSAEILAPPSAAIEFARIQPIPAGFEFADHGGNSFT